MRRIAEFHPTKPIRVLYADLDGTLTGLGGSLFNSVPSGTTPRGADAVARLHGAATQLVLVSGRTRAQTREAARMLGAAAYICELGAFVVDGDEVLSTVSRTNARATPFQSITRSGAGAFLLDRYAGRLEPHLPWSSEPREATLLLRGLLDLDEVTAALERAGYGWLEVRDNGVIRRPIETLDLPEVHVYHAVPRGVGKAPGIALHRERHGLDRAEVALVGDSSSDLEAAPEVGTVFIVANGAEAAAAAADVDNVFVTQRPAGDGVAEVVDAILGA